MSASLQSPPEPVATRREIEVVWAAGFLEGEGTFGYYRQSKSTMGTPTVAVGQNDPEPIERLQRVFPQFRYVSTHLTSAGNVHHTARCAGAGAAMVMVEVLPYMSTRRSVAIAAALAQFEQDEQVRIRKREFCPHGHRGEFGFRKTGADRQSRYCKACQREYMRTGKWPT